MIKKNCFISLIVVLCIFLTGINYVNGATTMSMDIKGNKTEFEPGDTLSIDLVVGCVTEGVNISIVDTGFEYDTNVFGIVDDKNVELRNGWNIKEKSGDNNGSYLVSVYTDSSKNFITSKNASEDCKDDAYTKLLSGYKLRVKDVENQKTTIWVTENGMRVSSIEVTIFKADNNNNLKSLEIEGVELEPGFNEKDTTYEAKVPYDKASIEIKAECEGENCSVSNTGEKTLEVGENRFEIIAIAEDGSKKIYNLFINREDASKDTSLSKLKIKDSNGNVLPIGFKSDKLNYNIDVDYDILFVEFEAECKGTNCEVEEIKTKKLEVGENIVKIKVNAEDGTTGEYKIIINRLKKKSIIPYVIIGVIIIGGIGTGIYFFIKKKKGSKKHKPANETVEEVETFDINNLE